MNTSLKKMPVLLLLFFALSFRGYGQPPARYTVPVFRFRNFSLVLGNTAMADSSKELLQRYFHLPVKERVYYTYSAYLQVLASPLPDPLQGSNVTSPVYEDTLASDGERMKLENLQVQVTNRDHPLDEKKWQDMGSLPKENYINSSTRYTWVPYISNILPFRRGDYYQVVTEFIPAYFNTLVVIRNKATREELLRFRFVAIGPPVTPFLDLWTTDFTDALKLDERTRVKGPEFYKPILDSNQQAHEYSTQLRNETLRKVNSLILHFRRPSWDYPDSSLEYRLLTQGSADTSWKITAHTLPLTHLAPGVSYSLQVRYRHHPAYRQEHRFYIMPEWYQTRQFRILIAIAAVLLLCLAMLFIYRRRIRSMRKKQERLTMELQSIRSQLNPHFVFNSLTSIQGLINKNDIAGANRYLTEFSSLLRDTLTSNNKEMLPLVTEARLLETYLELEKLRFGFSYRIAIEESIHQNDTEVPALLLQPLVENAVKHGVAGMGDKGLIQVQFSRDAGDLLVTVSDNGSGFNTNAARKGIGLSLTYNRIRLLNESLQKQSISIQTAPGTEGGTAVHLIFKNWL